jgi:hypothetical protein
MIDEIEDEDIYAFLEHYGVRGMHWGQRKARSSSGKSAKKPRTAAEKKLLRNRIIGGAMIGVGGALFAKMIMDQHKTMKARDAANIYNASKNIKRAQQVNDIISMNSGVRMTEVRTGFKVGPSSTVRSGFKVGKSGSAEALTTTRAVAEAIKSRR